MNNVTTGRAGCAPDDSVMLRRAPERVVSQSAAIQSTLSQMQSQRIICGAPNLRTFKSRGPGRGLPPSFPPQTSRKLNGMDRLRMVAALEIRRHGRGTGAEWYLVCDGGSFLPPLAPLARASLNFTMTSPELSGDRAFIDDARIACPSMSYNAGCVNSEMTFRSAECQRDEEG
jgi:hypothetical protein